MAWRNIHLQPFDGRLRDVPPLLRVYRTPILVLVMVACFVIGFSTFLMEVRHALIFIRENPIFSGLLPVSPMQPLVYLFLGDLLFAMLFWSFFKAMLTCAGYVPHEPWRHTPRFDRAEQRRVREQWAKQREWLEWNRYQQTMLQYQWRMHVMQQLAGMAAPPLVSPASISSSAAPSPSATGSALTMRESHGSAAQASGQCSDSYRLHSDGHVEGNGSTDPSNHVCSVAVRDGAFEEPDASWTSGNSGETDSRRSGTDGDDNHPLEQQHPRRDREDEMAHAGSLPHVAASSSHPSSKANVSQHGAGLSVQVDVSADTDAFSVPSKESNPFTVHELEADGSLRFCRICAQFKPDRSHHCRYCDRCTSGLDHHCFYLGNCVGTRNYKFFFLTITYGTACGWLCTAMYVHMLWVMYHFHQRLLALQSFPPFFPGGYAEFLTHLAEMRAAADFTGRWWRLLLIPVCMGLVNVLVFTLWCQHVGLLRRGLTTLERMREASVERFLWGMNVARYGRCAPETNRWCAMIAEAKERARCMLQPHTHMNGGLDEEAEYAKMLAREEREAGRTASSRPPLPNGGLSYAYGPNLSDRSSAAGSGGREALSSSSALPGTDRHGGSGTGNSRADRVRGAGGFVMLPLAERRARHFRRLFGYPAHGWHHLLPLTPRHTGEVPGEVDTGPRATKTQ